MCDGDKRRYCLRPRKPVDYSDDALFQELNACLRERGVTPEELAEDDRGEGVGHGVYKPLPETDIMLPDGRKIHVTAREGVTGCRVEEFIDQMSDELFDDIWFGDSEDSQKNRDALKSLLRYPGGRHEWLMIAAVPLLRRMKISMKYVKEVRTLTTRTCFYVSGVEYRHGGANSGRFHIDLLQCIRGAYSEYTQYGGDSLEILKKYLRRFVEVYYKPENAVVPEELKLFLKE